MAIKAKPTSVTGTLAKVFQEIFRWLVGLGRTLGLWFWPRGHYLSASIGGALKYMWRGFGPDAAELYDFEQYGRRYYLSDQEIMGKAVNIDAAFAQTVNNKLLWLDFMEGRVPTAKTLGFVKEGLIYPTTAAGMLKETVNEDFYFLKYLLRDSREVIFRSFFGRSGQGVFKLAWSQERGFQIGGTPLSMNDFRLKMESLDNYLISEKVEQADYGKNIFPDSANSIRLITLISPLNNSAFPAAAYHQFGARASAPADNLERGGCLANIDLNSGKMTEGFQIVNRQYVPVNRHPETKAAIIGVTVPNFSDIVKVLLARHQRINYIKCLAWDLVITNGGFVLLGARTNPDLTWAQSFRPLLAELPVFEFFSNHRVISR